MKRFALFIVTLILLFSISSAEGKKMNMENNSRVFYEIFVGSFSDSNGDGIGDLRGIINRMDYLNDGNPTSGESLGIEGIWLTPIFESPSYHKYDVTDYYRIDPVFGTMKDLQELICLCHDRDVKLILDLPLNHTSDRNEWFRTFSEAHAKHDPANPYYDFYTWLEEDINPSDNRRFVLIPEAGVQVECNFSNNMPELNFDSNQVRQAVLDIANFYLDLGVDGFRFDAAKYLYLGENYKDIAFWEWYLQELKKTSPQLYTVAEVWDGEGITNDYAKVVNCFHFSPSQAEGLYARTARGGDVNRLTRETERYLNELHAINPDAMNIPFISNHDTDRAAGYLTVASGNMQMGANLYILSPGSPFIYYGEEIGLRGSRGGASTDANRRLAMRWGDEDTVKDPVGSNYDTSGFVSVSDWEESKGSILWYYRKLIALRKANPEIARGTYTALSFPDTKAGGFLCEWNGSVVGVFHNTTKRTQKLDLSIIPDHTFSQITFIGIGEAFLDGNILTLEGQTSAVLR